MASSQDLLHLPDLEDTTFVYLLKIATYNESMLECLTSWSFSNHNKTLRY